MQKPELLAPAGTIEAFHAAIEAGADAIYLGMKQFNARNRAANFTPGQLKRIREICDKQNVKMYITLNTLIRNAEISEALDQIYQLQQIRPDAVIIQDWGIFWLLKHFFPQIPVHASTQMGIHNSSGLRFNEKNGIERSILARELRMQELEKMASRTQAEFEVFIHGALCYSFSGLCLFSSFLGGMSANRGLCKQPCRRIYHTPSGSDFIFSMKDNQALDLLPGLIKTGAKSLKIEGRMKSAEYVYRVTKAYRMALDDPKKIPEAQEILKEDMGRDKTSWFLGNDVRNAISDKPLTGQELGTVSYVGNQFFTLNNPKKIPPEGSRIRIFNQENGEQFTIRIKESLNPQDGSLKIPVPPEVSLQVGDMVFLTSLPSANFPSKLEGDLPHTALKAPARFKKAVFKSLPTEGKKPKPALYVRIDHLDWLKKLDFRNADHIILNFSRVAWDAFDPTSGLIQKFSKKLIIQLPAFISEARIKYYSELCMKLKSKGINRFMISHASQLELLPDKCQVLAAETLYSMNDFSMLFIHSTGIRDCVRPFESDLNNLKEGKDRNGIIPVYYRPALFFSRMPVNIPGHTRHIKDKTQEFEHVVKDGMTYIVPSIPVSLLQYTRELRKEGFRRFLIDLSFEKASSNRLKTIFKRFHSSEQIQPSSNFNFKLEEFK